MELRKRKFNQIKQKAKWETFFSPIPKNNTSFRFKKSSLLLFWSLSYYFFININEGITFGSQYFPYEKSESTFEISGFQGISSCNYAWKIINKIGVSNLFCLIFITLKPQKTSKCLFGWVLSLNSSEYRSFEISNIGIWKFRFSK